MATPRPSPLDRMKQRVAPVVKTVAQTTSDIAGAAKAMIPGTILKAGLKKAKSALDKATQK